MERIICTVSWRKPRPSSARRSRRQGSRGAEPHERVATIMHATVWCLGGTARETLAEASGVAVQEISAGGTMSTHARVSNPIYTFLPTDVEGFEALAELALDMRWSWHHGTDLIWQQLDPTLWALTHNPWGVLQTVSRDRLERMVSRSRFLSKRRAPRARETAGGGGAGVVSAAVSAGALDLCGVFQHGIYAERSAADLCWRPGQCGWRSAQSRQRPRRPRGRRGATLPARLFSSDAGPGRRAASAVPLQRSRAIADHTGTRSQRGVVAAGGPTARGVGLVTGLAGPGWQSAPVPTGQQ